MGRDLLVQNTVRPYLSAYYAQLHAKSTIQTPPGTLISLSQRTCSITHYTAEKCTGHLLNMIVPQTGSATRLLISIKWHHEVIHAQNTYR
jgi:hypothetical protein